MECSHVYVAKERSDTAPTSDDTQALRALLDLNGRELAGISRSIDALTDAVSDLVSLLEASSAIQTARATAISRHPSRRRP